MLGLEDFGEESVLAPEVIVQRVRLVSAAAAAISSILTRVKPLRRNCA